MKKFLVSIVLMVSLTGSAYAANTAVLTGNRIVITGDTIADNGNYNVWAGAGGLGWTVGTEKVTIESWCWYGADIAIGDVCELETADGEPLGAAMIAVVAGQTLCHPPINATIDRLYIDQLSHGTIVIFIKQIGTPR